MLQSEDSLHYSILRQLRLTRQLPMLCKGRSVELHNDCRWFVIAKSARHLKTLSLSLLSVVNFQFKRFETFYKREMSFHTAPCPLQVLMRFSTLLRTSVTADRPQSLLRFTVSALHPGIDGGIMQLTHRLKSTYLDESTIRSQPMHFSNTSLTRMPFSMLMTKPAKSHIPINRFAWRWDWAAVQSFASEGKGCAEQ